MRKSDIKTAENHDLIREYALAYSSLLLNYNSMGRGVKRLTDLCNAMEDELANRGLLTSSDVERLRA